MSDEIPAENAPAGRIPFIEFISPEIRAEANRLLPSRQQRKENLNNLEVHCDAQCGKALARSEIKVCGRCKQARYCSQACQKAHWKAGHKIECGEGSVNDLVFKLAERALAVPKIVEHFWMISIELLGLLADASEAGRFAIKVQCKTQPVDMMAALRRAMNGENDDANAQVALHYAGFAKVPLGDAPARTRKAAEAAREKLQAERKDAEGAPVRGDAPVVAYYFVSEQDDTGKDGLLSAAWVLPDWTLAYMRSNPKSLLRSAMFGDKKVPVDMETLTDGVNSVVRMDKANKLKLRGYPTKERPVPQPQEEKFVMYVPGDDDE